MAAGSASRIIFAPGRLVVNPTQAFSGGTYPYGGTEVGKTNAVAMLPLGTPFNVEYESTGEIGDVLEGDNRWVVSCFLRGWDDDAVEQFLSDGYAEGAVTQHAVYEVPGTKTPGQSALDRAVKLLYVPDDDVHVPALIAYRAVPDWSEGAEVAYQRREELGIPVAFECVRGAGGNTLRKGRLRDLALT